MWLSTYWQQPTKFKYHICFQMAFVVSLSLCNNCFFLSFLVCLFTTFLYLHSSSKRVEDESQKNCRAKFCELNIFYGCKQVLNSFDFHLYPTFYLSSFVNLCLFSIQFLNAGHILRCCTARGSSTRFTLVGSTKLKAHKSFPFTEKLPCIEK